jgi:hypothetical protein
MTSLPVAQIISNSSRISTMMLNDFRAYLKHQTKRGLRKKKKKMNNRTTTTTTTTKTTTTTNNNNKSIELFKLN